jgi:hypothetical protein
MCMLKGMVGSYLCAAAVLLSSVGNKICGRIQCRSLGTFVGLLAPLLLSPVSPILAKLSLFSFPTPHDLFH